MIIEELIQATKGYHDPKEWHPERNLYEHVSIVTARAFLQHGDMSLVCAAILHDLAKPISGREHAKTMSDLINTNDDIRYWIHSMGGKIDLVERIVYHHMDKIVTKKNKTVTYIDTFFIIDDMINRCQQIDGKKMEFILPDGQEMTGTIMYIGISPIQAMFQNSQFTVLVDDLPLTFSLDQSDWILKGILSGQLA